MDPVHLSIPSPDPSWSQFQLGPLTVHTYALCILTGIIAAVLIAQRRLTARGGQPDHGVSLRQEGGQVAVGIHQLLEEIVTLCLGCSFELLPGDPAADKFGEKE